MWRAALAMILCKTASQVSVSGLPVSVSVSVEVIDGYKNITFQTSKESVYIKKKYHIWEEKRIFTKNTYKKIWYYRPQKCV